MLACVSPRFTPLGGIFCNPRRSEWVGDKGGGERRGAGQSQGRGVGAGQGGDGASSGGAGHPDLPLEPVLPLLPGAGDYAGAIRAPEWKGDWDP